MLAAIIGIANNRAAVQSILFPPLMAYSLRMVIAGRPDLSLFLA